MILLLCFDLRRRGGIERLSLQVRDSSGVEAIASK